MPKRYVGKNIYKVDAQDKVTGKAIYPDDIYFDDMLYLKIKRATHPHAYLRRIDTSKAEKLPGVVKIITAADIPQVKNFGLIIKDQPVLVGIGQKMRYMGDALAMVIAESKEAACFCHMLGRDSEEWLSSLKRSPRLLMLPPH